MASRPKGYGMTAELQRKKDGKYDSGLENEAREFITGKTGRSVDGDFYTALRDGVTLCHLANALKPGSVKKINEGKMAFKMMENIGNFLKVCEALGVKPSDSFQTVDLYENQNLPQILSLRMDLIFRVVNGILSVKRKVTGGESKANVREFTEEQKRAGSSVIGLQMGSNKGASQKGDHFGRPRQVAGPDAHK